MHDTGNGPVETQGSIWDRRENPPATDLQADRPGCLYLKRLTARFASKGLRGATFSEPRRPRATGVVRLRRPGPTALGATGASADDSVKTLSRPTRTSRKDVQRTEARNPGTGACAPTYVGVPAAVPYTAYQAKWANALFASAMRWTFSRVVIAVPSPR